MPPPLVLVVVVTVEGGAGPPPDGICPKLFGSASSFCALNAGVGNPALDGTVGVLTVCCVVVFTGDNAKLEIPPPPPAGPHHRRRAPTRTAPRCSWP
jgi:hypothetical protein